MSDAISKRACIMAVAMLVMAWTARPAFSENVTFTFSGQITEVVSTPPAPFADASVGSIWSLAYTFDPTVQDVDPSQDAGQYRDAVTSMTLTIGSTTVTGVPGQYLPNELYSLIGVNLTPDYDDYTAQMGLPDIQAWTQVALVNTDLAVFDNDSLPQVLPTPFEEFFPDRREFFLKEAGSSRLYLRGEIGQVARGSFSQVRAEFDIRPDIELSAIDLLYDPDLFGEERFATGLYICPGCEVRGVEPSPFHWQLDPEGGIPQAGEAVVSFLVNPGGEVMGVEPSPFHCLLVNEQEVLGELDFGDVTGAYSGVLGSLHLEGVLLELRDTSVVEVDGFDIHDVSATAVLEGSRADFLVSATQVETELDFLADSAIYGPGGFASGFFTCPGCEKMGVVPSPFIWMVDPLTGTPQDGTAALSLLGVPGSEVMGVEPSPFRYLVAIDQEVLGEVVLDDAVGTYPSALGALLIEGALLALSDGTVLDIESLEVFDVYQGVVLDYTQADLQVYLEPEFTQVAFLVNSAAYGSGGFASGWLMCPGCEVMGVEPSPFSWQVDPLSGVPEDGTAAVSFLGLPGSEVMGVEPSPFRYLLTSGQEALGEVDFSAASGYWGSFYLEGVRVLVSDGSAVDVEGFHAADVDVEIDIKPGSEPNSINLGSSGVIPVAILSSLAFDATTVDPETVRLAGASVRLVGNGKRYLAHTEDVNGDGLDDLVCQVLTDEILIEVGQSIAVLEAETDDGTAIRGEDFIRIVPD